ncbi:MAG: hypothetical protein SGBAC_004946 [Bacillariaceae sp.]
MGTDIFNYKVEKIEGKTVTIDYKSGQHQGLAPDGAGLDAAAHWVCALAEHDKAFLYGKVFQREPSCPLTQHERWKQPTGDVLILDFPKITMDDIKHFIADYEGKTCSYGHTGSRGSIEFQSVDKARQFIDDWNGKQYKGDKLRVVFKNVENGPEWIDQYSRPEDDFEGFVENVEVVTVYYENRDEEQGYWNTAASYKVTMTDEAYLSHLKRDDVWQGR